MRTTKPPRRVSHIALYRVTLIQDDIPSPLTATSQLISTCVCPIGLLNVDLDICGSVVAVLAEDKPLAGDEGPRGFHSSIFLWDWKSDQFALGHVSSCAFALKATDLS